MLWLIPLVLLGLLLYWELVIAEGVHLGPRVVVWLYDLAAPRYERIKKFDPAVEDEFLGLPIVVELIDANAESPRVLDVAAGTGRVARCCGKPRSTAWSSISNSRGGCWNAGGERPPCGRGAARGRAARRKRSRSRRRPSTR